MSNECAYYEINPKLQKQSDSYLKYHFMNEDP